MESILFNQSAADASHSRIRSWRETYAQLNSAAHSSFVRFPEVDSSISPPLSDIEIADIEESELEFLTGTVEVYDNVEDLLTTLHFKRDLAQGKQTE